MAVPLEKKHNGQLESHVSTNHIIAMISLNLEAKLSVTSPIKQLFFNVNFKNRSIQNGCFLTKAVYSVH